MSYCFNPACPAPTVQIADARFCSQCGAALQLAQRYRATARIGQGQFGQTFLAVDEITKQRCIIRQVPIPPLDGPPLQAQPWRHRSHALRQLSPHPQLPALLAWFTQQRQYYWVFDLIEGPTLETPDLTLDSGQILQLLASSLPVLQALHGAGIHHGDLKPANFILAAPLSDDGPLPPSRLVGVDFGRSYPALPHAHRSDLQSLGRLCAYLLTPPPRPDWSTFEGQVPPVDAALQNAALQTVLSGLMAPGADGYGSAKEAAAAVAAIAQNREGAAPSFNEAPTLVPQAPPEEAIPEKALEDALTDASGMPASGAEWSCRHTLTGHKAWVRAVAFSADGRWVISGSGDKTVKVWSAETGELHHTLTGHDAWVRAVVAHPKQPLAASASNDKSIHLWHVETGQRVRTLRGHSDWIRALCFLPGYRLASAAQDKTILLWDLASETVTHTLQGHQHWVLALARSPDGAYLVSGSRDRTLRLWDLSSGQCRRVLTGHRDEVTCVVICPHTGHIISGSKDQTIRYWRWDSGDCSHVVDCSAGISDLAIEPQQRLLAAGNSDKTICLWTLEDRRPAARFTGHDNWVWSVSFAPTAPPQLVSGSWDGTVKIWCPADTAR